MKKAPTAADIAGLGDDYYLNLPATRSATPASTPRTSQALKREGKAPPITYAHIAREKGRAGLALQYWFFWYFNQFNDLHEGDWEGMQVVFEARNPARGAATKDRAKSASSSTPAARGPTGTDGKVAEGRDAPDRLPRGRLARDLLRLRRLRRERPARAPASAATTPPNRCGELRRRARSWCPTNPAPNRPVRLAHLRRPLGPEGEGLQQRPDRAGDEDRWREPFTWMEEQPHDQPAPARSARSLGPTVTGAFCGAVADVSDFINLERASRARWRSSPGLSSAS